MDAPSGRDGRPAATRTVGVAHLDKGRAANYSDLRVPSRGGDRKKISLSGAGSRIN